MKIAIITSQYGQYWSGLGTYATNLVNGLADKGHSVTVISPDVADKVPHKGVNVIGILGMRVAPTLGNWPLLSYYYSKALSGLLKGRSFDVIHFVDARESLFCSVRGVPVLGTMHDYYFSEASVNPLKYKRLYHDWLKRWAFYNITKILERVAVKRVDCLITNTDYVANSMVKFYRLKEEVVHAVPLGIYADFKKKSSPVSALSGKPSILFIGGNFQRKGLPTLIRAVAALKESYPEILLYVAGRDRQKGAVESAYVSSGMKDSVYFLGWKSNEEVRSLLSGVNIFCMPSLIEGFGLVFLEAMASNVPVIGSRTGGIPELIKDGKNGFLVTPEDWRGLAEKIAFLTENRKFADGLVENGLKTVKEFSVEKMVMKTETLYRRVIKEFTGLPDFNGGKS